MKVVNCFACSQGIPTEASHETKISLKKLCRILKLPATVVTETLGVDCQTPEINNDDLTYCCHACLSIIDQAQYTYNQIQIFESNLATLRNKMKDIICTSFKSGVGTLTLGDECNPSQVIKKTFVQCWKGWQVPLVRINKDDFCVGMPNTSEKKKTTILMPSTAVIPEEPQINKDVYSDKLPQIQIISNEHEPEDREKFHESTIIATTEDDTNVEMSVSFSEVLDIVENTSTEIVSTEIASSEIASTKIASTEIVSDEISSPVKDNEQLSPVFSKAASKPVLKTSKHVPERKSERLAIKRLIKAKADDKEVQFLGDHETTTEDNAKFYESTIITTTEDNIKVEMIVSFSEALEIVESTNMETETESSSFVNDNEIQPCFLTNSAPEAFPETIIPFHFPEQKSERVAINRIKKRPGPANTYGNNTTEENTVKDLNNQISGDFQPEQSKPKKTARTSRWYRNPWRYRKKRSLRRNKIIPNNKSEQVRTNNAVVPTAPSSTEFLNVTGKDIHPRRIRKDDVRPPENQLYHPKFTSQSKLTAHSQARHQPPQQTKSKAYDTEKCTDCVCTVCSLKFRDVPSLEGHVREKHVKIELQYCCRICSKTYKKMQYLEEHMRTDRKNDRVFTCRSCDGNGAADKTIPGPSSKVETMTTTEVDKKPFSCLSSKKQIHSHVARKHRKNNCKKCEKSFPSPHELKHHFKTHKADRAPQTYICEICGAVCVSLKNLEAHQMSHQNVQKPPVTCKDCGKCFSEPRTLKLHRDSVHANRFAYTCQVCGIECQEIDTLNRHMLCHTEKKTFQCIICCQRFERKQELQIHQRTHTRQRAFKCHYCGKAFMEKKKLKNHENLHKGLKPNQSSLSAQALAPKHPLNHHTNVSQKNHMKSVDPSQRRNVPGDKVYSHGTENYNQVRDLPKQELQVNHFAVEPRLVAMASSTYGSSQFIPQPLVAPQEEAMYSSTDNEFNILDAAVGEWILDFVQNI